MMGTYLQAVPDEPTKCEECGHRARHIEYRPTRLKIVSFDGRHDYVETPHPRYRPWLFHCTVEGCYCEVQR